MSAGRVWQPPLHRDKAALLTPKQESRAVPGEGSSTALSCSPVPRGEKITAIVWKQCGHAKSLLTAAANSKHSERTLDIENYKKGETKPKKCQEADD